MTKYRIVKIYDGKFKVQIRVYFFFWCDWCEPLHTHSNGGISFWPTKYFRTVTEAKKEISLLRGRGVYHEVVAEFL